MTYELSNEQVAKRIDEMQVSLDMQRELPDADGFSTTNLWYEKRWYLFYNQNDTILQ